MLVRQGREPGLEMALGLELMVACLALGLVLVQEAEMVALEPASAVFALVLVMGFVVAFKIDLSYL